MRHDVGIGYYAATKNPDDSIKTYALGSCVAVVLYSASNGVVGMIHIALPESQGHDEKASKLPGYFADTGLPLLWKKMTDLGTVKGRVTAKLVGGSQILDENGTFDIGKRNVLASRKWLWTAGIGLMKEDTGGKSSRTVEAFPDGRVLVTSNRETVSL